MSVRVLHVDDLALNHGGAGQFGQPVDAPQVGYALLDEDDADDLDQHLGKQAGVEYDDAPENQDEHV